MADRMTKITCIQGGNNMKRMSILAVILVLALALSACGSEKAPEATVPATTAPAVTEAPAPVVLALSDWSMSASTWSSPNGATIHVSAVPAAYADGLIAAFEVRLNGEDVAVVPCEWDGTVFTASAELNAADGYSYYIVLTAPDGTSEEIGINTASQPTVEAFVNMETALASYCSVTVEESAFEGGKLTLASGKVQVQAPTITDDSEVITCTKAELVLLFNGETLDTESLTLSETETAGLFEAQLQDIIFDVPEMEDDQQLDLYLNVTLSNDQILSAFGGNWFYNNQDLLPVVG